MKEGTHDLSFMDAYFEREYLYAVSFENIFFRAKRGSVYHAEVLGFLNGFQNKGVGKIYAIQYYRKSLYMFCSCTYEVVKYDFSTQKFSYYYPAEYNETFGPEGGICRIKNDVWILQDIFEKKICVFSLDNCSYRFLNLDTSVLSNNIEPEEIKFAAKEKICRVGDKVWRCVPGTDYLYSIDVTTRKIELHKTGAEIEIFTISHDENGFYLISMYGETLVQWEENRGVVSRKRINGEKQLKAFRDILRGDRCYILIPGKSDEVKLLSEEGEITGTCRLPSRFHRRKGIKRGLFLNYFEEKGKVLLFPFGGNGMVEIDKGTLETKYYPVCIPQREYMKILLAEGQDIIERETLPLSCYVTTLPVRRHTEKEIYGYGGTIGRQIMKITEPKI